MKHVWYPPTGWNPSLKLSSVSLLCTLQNEICQFWVLKICWLAPTFGSVNSTRPDCKSCQKSEQKLCSVFQSLLKLFHNQCHMVSMHKLNKVQSEQSCKLVLIGRLVSTQQLELWITLDHTLISSSVESIQQTDWP